MCSGTRQSKLVISMYSLDSFTGRHPGNHLQRSSDLLRMSASPRGTATDDSIDRILRVVLTGNGPSMVRKSTLCVLRKVRCVGNILFTRYFADVSLRLMLLNDSRLRRCMDFFQTHIQLSRNELGFSSRSTRKRCGRHSCVSSSCQIFLVAISSQSHRFCIPVFAGSLSFHRHSPKWAVREDLVRSDSITAWSRVLYGNAVHRVYYSRAMDYGDLHGRQGLLQQ